MEQHKGEWRNCGVNVTEHNIENRSIVGVSSLKSDLSEQRRSCGAQVVGDEQLGVGVDSCRVELPQRLEAQ